MMDVLSLQGKLTLDTSSYSSSLAGAESGMQGFGNTLKGVLGAQIITKGFQTITNGFKSIITAGAEFDKSMAQVAATMGLTMDAVEIDTLREFAQEMGANTAWSASQCAEALNYMALAGYSVEKSQRMLPQVLNLASAGNMDLARASDMVTDAQTALGLSIEQTEQMIDQMAKTASTTNTSVEQLGDAILTVGGTAQYMSGGTEQIAKVLGVMADNGIKGSEAGTHLRNMLLKLASPTTEGTRALQELGVSIFDDTGRMRDFAEIFPELNASMANLTEEQRLQKLSTIFNARDIASVNALLNTNSDRWTEIAGAIEDAEGSAQRMAETQLDNLAGSTTLFKSALEGAKIAISDKVAPALKGLVDMGTRQLSGFTQAFKENGLGGALQFVGGEMDSLMQKADSIFPNISGLWETLKSVFGAVTDFIKSKSEDFGAVFEKVKSVFSSFVETVTVIWENFGSTIMDYVGSVWDYIKDYITIALDVIKGIIDLIGAIIKGDWEGIWESVKSIVVGAWNFIVNIVTLAVETIASILEAIWTVITNLAGNAWTGIKNFFVNIWNSIVDTITGAVENIKNKIHSGFESAKQTVVNIFNGIKSAITDRIEAAKNKVKSIIDAIRGFFKFEWSLPKLKMPHITITGEFSLVPPSIPKFSIDWYKKAYNRAYKFDTPTVLSGLGFGDGVGGEIVMGESFLEQKLSNAMDGKINDLVVVVGEVLQYMKSYFPSFANQQIVLDSDVLVGALGTKIDAELAVISDRRVRG